MSSTDAARAFQDAALIFDLFSRSDLKQLELRTGTLDVYVARCGLCRAPPVVTAGALGIERGAGEVLKAPHLATLRAVARPGDVIPAGSAWATLEVLGVEEPLTHDVELTVSAAFAVPGDLVEFGAALIETATTTLR